MKSYILLRNNQQFGAFTLQELKTFGINSTDLIWIKDESTSWTYPTEINELKTIAEQGIKIPLRDSSTMTVQNNETFPFSNHPETLAAAASQDFTSAPDKAIYANYPSDQEDEFHWESKKHRRGLPDISSGFFGLGVLLVGAILGVFVAKNLSSHFKLQPHIASAQAIEISKETLPVSTSSNAAKTTTQTVAVSAMLNTSHTNSAATTLVASAGTKVVQKKKKPVSVTPLPDDKIVQETTAAETNEAIAEKPKEEEPETSTIVKKAPSLELTANDYKVGMFGGISELELSINNPSSLPIDKATVEVEFLKKNGSVVKSQILSVENISPGGVKKLVVPSSNRGVKVRYRVVSVQVQDEN